jgi:pSer/pThr/pTyr-binding forkhead associated (FHA) protein
MAIAKQYKLGRYDECEIVMDHITVSRVHAEFFVDPHLNVFLTDLNSSYGTFVNLKRISEPVFLSKGDIVSFGDEQYFDWEHQFLGVPKKKFNPEKVEIHLEESEHFFTKNKDILLIYSIDIILFILLYFWII